MNAQPTLFINRLTTVDCALLSHWGVSVKERVFAEALGFSFNVSVELSGKLDPVENVVVDFGALKKSLKAEIDHIDYGYDHKLIVPKCFLETDDELLTFSVGETDTIVKNGGVEILKVPNNALRYTQTDYLTSRLSESVGFIESMIYRDYDEKNGFIQNSNGNGLIELLGALGLELKEFLQSRVDILYPNQGIVIERVRCDCDVTLPNPLFLFDSDVPNTAQRCVTNFFSYTHGLKKSTSMGCRNIVHGHLSYIQLVGSAKVCATKEFVEYTAKVSDLCNSIASDLNCAHFAHKENLVVSDDGSTLQDKYNADGRGEFAAVISAKSDIPSHKNGGTSQSLFSKTVEVDDESTIENLTRYIFDTYKEELLGLDICTIYVSEGLHKGSYYHVKSKSN
jgi:6-pyruvoyl-tetrahydropterin synthase